MQLMSQFKSGSFITKGALLLVMASIGLGLTACSKAPVELTSVKFIGSLDKGSGNFDRVLELCFSEPLTSTYFHKVEIITNEKVKITGSGNLRPLASDPDNKCHLRNIYSYIHKDSPIDARLLIKDYVVAGNVSQVVVQVYEDKSKIGEVPLSEKLFKNL